MTARQIANTPDRPELVRIPLKNLVPHPLNSNVMPDRLKAKLAANIRASGRYPPLIVRPLDEGLFQILDGHQRADVLRELGETTAVCYVWPASDEEALLLLGTLNRLEGQDIPGRRAVLIAELQAHETLAELARLLPETEAELEATLELLPRGRSSSPLPSMPRMRLLSRPPSRRQHRTGRAETVGAERL